MLCSALFVGFMEVYSLLCGNKAELDQLADI